MKNCMEFTNNHMIENNKQRIICSDGAELFLMKDSDFEQYEELEKSLRADGFAYYDKRKEGDVIFSSIRWYQRSRTWFGG